MLHRDPDELRRYLHGVLEMEHGIVQRSIERLEISRNFFNYLLARVDLKGMPERIRRERVGIFSIMGDGNPGSRRSSAA
jgi:hypothetical protein